jgi:Family of unknown function (DUF5677)
MERRARTLRERLFEGFVVKLFSHAGTILLLSSESAADVPDISPSFSVADHPSMMVVTRAMLETYIVASYLFAPRQTRDHRDFRRYAWELGDLLERQDLIATEGFAIKQLAREALRIEKLKRLLDDNTYFRSLGHKRRDRILKGQWRLGGWQALAVEVGLHGKFFAHVYAYLCSYAHSGSSSIGQIYNAQSADDRDPYVRICLQTGLTLIASFIAISGELAERLSSELLSNGVANKLVEAWRH